MDMEWLEQLLGKEWSLIPAGGVTGDAYIAQNGQQKLFLKRNTSPFLAVLSAEGIVPKLLWTRRITNGDVISAQKWLPGKKLEPEDMKLERVAKLLKKIHSSKALVQMIQRLGKQPLHAQELLQQLYFVLRGDIKESQTIKAGLQYLKVSLYDIEYDEFVVCHCDVNHNNWLLSDEDELFLIDWDGAVIADPALDLGMLLYWYVPREQWEEWLAYYGIEKTDSLLRRMKWYVVAQTILSIQWHIAKKQQAEAEYWHQYLQQLLAE
ncbi:phosphotransferase [Bacillus cytotoxicus]|uniref:phosphotransferase family protein n=1 Tax=Bacillus cereus group sp. BfR-BA-01492 TaxID=2920361 RepID=UPI001F58C06E|nr:phosphotransferase family protein [Bacillus cereus group sp. BfR-BA-01492]EMA6342593.1 phosphotransferase family protein [Bacillus cytotoxicus]